MTVIALPRKRVLADAIPGGLVRDAVLVLGGAAFVGLLALDLKAVAAASAIATLFHPSAAAAERSTGYVVGGISPVGQKRDLPTVIDESALAFDRVYVSGGRRGLDISLPPGDLVGVTRACVAAIAR